MKIAAAGLVSALLATACSSASASPSPRIGVLAPLSRAATAPVRRYLYVSNSTSNSVTEYAPGSSTLLRTISTGLTNPVALALDASNYLYVGNQPPHNQNGSVAIFGPGSNTPLRTLAPQDSPFYPNSLAIDPISGKLFVDFTFNAIGGGGPWSFVSVYGPQGNPYLHATGGGGQAQQIVVDRTGRVAVPFYFWPSPNGHAGFAVESSKELKGYVHRCYCRISALAVDQADLLYVAYTFLDNPPYKLYPQQVDVYAPNGFQLRTLPASNPYALAIGLGGELYVANGGDNSITVFAGSKNVRRIAAGISGPSAMVFDDQDNLYVSNRGNNTVTVYAPGQTSVLRTITDGISGPTALAIGTQ